jgi:beta-lactamase regulating signal transducer with metallopeptidase domain/biopolymer transport protein ExbD
MNPALLQHALASAFDWTWKTSLAATILIALVLFVQVAFAKVLSPRWRYGLGLLILLRLVLPAAPASPLSIFNLGNHSSQPVAVETPTTTIQPLVYPLVAPVLPATPEATVSEPMSARSTLQPQSSKISVREIATWTWLAGFAAMLAMVARQQRNFMRRLGRWEAVREPRVLEMLESCRAQLGVRRNVAVLAATGLNTPALFGIGRPRLLLPAEMLERLDDRELRHVLLHELIHLQRGDLFVNWTMILLRAAHWFNPAVWFAFRRLRAEQELACDAAVMARLAADERRDYGRTLLKLLDDFSPGALCPGYVPFITSKQIIKRRITMISNFKPAGRLAAGASIVLLIALGSLTFTRADETHASADQKDTGQSGSDDQSRSTTIQTSDGSVTLTFSKDGTAKVGTNMTLRAPAAVTVGRDGMMRVTAEKVQMDMPRTPSYQYNGFTCSTGGTATSATRNESATAAGAPRGGVLVVAIDKNGAIRIGSDPKPVEPSAVGEVLISAIGGNRNPFVELQIDEAAVDLTKQFVSVLTALRQANVPVVKFTTGHVIDGTNVTATIQMGDGPNPGLAQSMVQAQAQMQRAQVDLARQQAAMQYAYDQTLATQPDASVAQTFTTDKLTVSPGNQAGRAAELAAENIRLTEAKLNDLRNLKETYASDAAEHSSDQRELTSKLNDMLVEAEAQRAGKAALLRQLEKMSREEQRQALPTTVPDATLDKLMQDQLAAEDKLAEQSQNLGALNPEVQGTKKMLEKLNSQIDARVKGILNGLRAQVQAEDDTIQNLQQQINAKSQRQTELTDLASQIAKTESELRDLKSQLAGVQDYQTGNATAMPQDSKPSTR